MIKNYDEIIDIVMTFTVKEYLLFGKKKQNYFHLRVLFFKKIMSFKFSCN